MNTTDPGTNVTLSFGTENTTLSSLVTTTTSPSVPLPPSYSSDIHDPEFTILIVLGLSLLLAGVAAFLVVCQPSEQDGDSESCSPGDSFGRGRNQSSEPQLKVWKRFGSYRRSYNLSFRRPPHRRPHERESIQLSQPQATQTPQPAASAEPQLTTPCLFNYVTEI